MYTPLYYLLKSEDGYVTSTVAKFWRIRTGINQGDTALTTEVNLALALESYDGVKDLVLLLQEFSEVFSHHPVQPLY